MAGRPLPSPSPRGSQWPGAGLWRHATIPPCSCLRRLRQAQVRGPWPRSGRRPAHLLLLYVVRRRPDACFLPSVVRRRPGLSPFPQWPGAEAAARAVLTALAGRREEPVAGEPRPREAVGAAAGRRVAARDPSPLRRPASGGRSTARSHGRSSPDRRLRFCEMTWPNEKPRNWPGIVGRDMHGKLKQQLKFFTPTQFVNLLEKHILFWHIYSQCNHVRCFAIFHISK